MVSRNIIMIILVLQACISENKKKLIKHDITTKSEDYLDINLFTLDGIKKIDNPQGYPYIKIANISDSEINITYHASDSIRFIRKYSKEFDYWTGNYDIEGDTTNYKMYEYIKNDRIIKLISEIIPGKDQVIVNISVLQNNKEISYEYYSGINKKPSIDVADIMHENKPQRIITKEIYNEKGILKIVEKCTFNQTNTPFNVNEVCYKIGDRSYFWWCYFGSPDYKINCP
ncbi:hypothetical protein HB364_27660 [Pseudoflavitalea sp. X16]|uniref:hypothetical protein n=1 Tax=Paraflavitalea devenefica TaxID=2716334 RepID=UPI0014229207|nr:hypothetical protein [Paraflavitalea devenefica]NII28886.1 hypothetical protein [Paraflavitalea devenefica]